MRGNLSKAKKIVLIAGEPSGDFLGASLMRALKTLLPSAPEFFGVGGALMEAEGITPFFPLSDLNIMGLTETFSKIPLILNRLRATKQDILALQPDVIITIDFPGFNFRLAKSLKGVGIPLIHYVAPTVWAWRPKRAMKFSRVFDHVLALYPFEPDCFSHVSLPVTFVGHPLVEEPLIDGNRDRFLTQHTIPDTATILTVLPGSRESEIKKLLPIFQETISILSQKIKELVVVIPTVREVEKSVRAGTEDWACPVKIVQGQSDKMDAYAASTVALASSGTIALELAKAQLPMVITYKVSSISAGIARRLLTVQYACMINILNDTETVPECLQENCTPEILADELFKLIQDPVLRKRQVSGGTAAIESLSNQGTAPSVAAAKIVLQYLDYSGLI